MSAQPTALLVLTGTLGTKLNAVNTGVGVKNPDGSTNVRSTVIGIAQSVHSVVWAPGSVGAGVRSDFLTASPAGWRGAGRIFLLR